MPEDNRIPNSDGKFSLGQVVATAHAARTIPSDEMMTALSRHVRGDWGDVGEDDRNENEISLKEGFRLLSVYRTETGVKFWIITEADRSVTTVLMPEDY
jgi:hypothetical protein